MTKLENSIQHKEDNMVIWNEVQKTNTEYTKTINFGRKFTAIDAHYQIMRATEVFGPIGIGWGIDHSKYTVLVMDQNDHNYNLLQYTGTLWYNHLGFRAQFDIAADIELFANTKNGWKRTEDSHKKVRTDALTKGLSWLGFNADVFLKKFDDNKYVQRLKQEEREAELAKHAPVQQQTASTAQIKAPDLKQLKSEIWAIGNKQLKYSMATLQDISDLIAGQPLENLGVASAKLVLKHLKQTQADIHAADQMKPEGV